LLRSPHPVCIRNGYVAPHTGQTRHGHTIAPATLSAWIAEHRDLATYARLREEGRKLATPAQAIRTMKLYHRQVVSMRITGRSWHC
jgi:hypothetical protein